MFASLKMLAVWISLGSLAGIIGIPYTLIVGDISLLFRVAMWIVRAGTRAAGIVVEVSGLEHVPADRACIFMSNHVSNLDPPVTMPVIPGRFSALLKKSLMKIPILGTALRMAQFVPVERGSQRESAQATMAAAGKALRDGLHIVVYPEGTRSLDGRLSTFKKGPFFLAMQNAATIIPVAVSGTREMLPKGSSAVVPGMATVRMLAPIEAGSFANREELMAAVHRALAAGLPEDMRPLASGPST